MPKTPRTLSRRKVWPAVAAAFAVACVTLGAWATRPTFAERCNAECGQPVSLNGGGYPDVSRGLCNRLCVASAK
jgi:hypothetical protein